MLDTVAQAIPDEVLLDRIEQIRARNNRHWMNVVRIALKYAPSEAKAELRAIEQCDGEVRALTRTLAGSEDAA